LLNNELHKVGCAANNLGPVIKNCQSLTY
jgi:hypothetical protein